MARQLPEQLMPFQDATVSNTTTRNTSRFVLMTPVVHNTHYVNFQPALRSEDAGRGVSFYLTESDPIALYDSGHSAI
jgi:hypothetical protein